MKQLIISGSRSWPANRIPIIETVLGRVKARGESPLVITGGARGVDTFAHNAAKQMGFETLVVMADWDTFGKRAGIIRNCQMLDLLVDGDEVWAFRAPGESRGTDHMISIAREAGFDTYVYDPSYYVGIIPVVAEPIVVVDVPKPEPRDTMWFLREDDRRVLADHDGVLVNANGAWRVKHAAFRKNQDPSWVVRHADRTQWMLLTSKAKEGLQWPS